MLQLQERLHLLLFVILSGKAMSRSNRLSWVREFVPPLGVTALNTYSAVSYQPLSMMVLGNDIFVLAPVVEAGHVCDGEKVGLGLGLCCCDKVDVYTREMVSNELGGLPLGDLEQIPRFDGDPVRQTEDAIRVENRGDSDNVALLACSNSVLVQERFNFAFGNASFKRTGLVDWCHFGTLSQGQN